VNFFCYPAGKFNATTIRATRQAGYLGATTELPGEASRDRMFELHRIRVEGSDGVSGLREKLQQPAPSYFRFFLHFFLAA
jgi:hypothetical protein